MKKIGIVTPYKGYNFGTSLQAYAVKRFIENLGYSSYVIGKKQNYSKGRDISLKKLLIIFFRAAIRPNIFIKTFSSYKNNLKKNLSNSSKSKFIEFTSLLDIHEHSIYELNKLSKKDDFISFITGSDQVWNATNLYLDPFYYLTFAPESKRVAFAPSFGKSQVKKYNEKPIGKRIKKFKKLSCREKEGVAIIKKIANRNAIYIIDPTLLIKKNQWKDLINIKYEKKILLYFLDEPNDLVKYLLNILNDKGHKFITLNYYYEAFDNLDVETIEAGPIEFLNNIYNCDYILTDSFHGTAFSINFNKNFYVFNRNYGSAENQSTRINSLLNICDLEDRFIQTQINKLEIIDLCRFEKVNEILNNERLKAQKYLVSAFEG